MMMRINITVIFRYMPLPSFRPLPVSPDHLSSSSAAVEILVQFFPLYSLTSHLSSSSAAVGKMERNEMLIQMMNYVRSRDLRPKDFFLLYFRYLGMWLQRYRLYKFPRYFLNQLNCLVLTFVFEVCELLVPSCGHDVG